jgi:hypothetical protein
MKRIIINHKYTYETDLEVKVGDTVVLPSPRKSLAEGKVSAWRGSVTALTSLYDGPCKKVIRVISEPELPLESLPAPVSFVDDVSL